MLSLLLIPPSALALIALVIIALDRRERQRFSHWESTEGRIVSARRRAGDAKGLVKGRQSGATGGVEIHYEYEIVGKTFRGSRISPDDAYLDSGEISANPQKYSVGAQTTVWYDPADPSQSILRYGAPPFAALSLLLLAGLGFALWAGAVIATDIVRDWQGGALGDPRRPPAAVLFALAGAALLVTSLRWHLLAIRARQRWIKVEGTILHSETVRRWSPSPGKSSSGPFAVEVPVIRYAYRVGAERYVGDRFRFGGTAAVSTPRSAHHRVGETVEVFVDPQNPENSVLEPRAAGAGVGLLLSAIFLVLGGHFAGFF